MQAQPHANRQTYLGLFLVALATLMYELLLTRIFSVTMWYHFAFVAVSVAMFGMTVGAIIVYLLPRLFTPEGIHKQLALSALMFSLSTVLSFLGHVNVPFAMDDWQAILTSSAILYPLVSVPFVFSGICVSLCLTRFPRQVSRLYAADLAGAAVGCVLLVVTLSAVDGPSAVLITSGIASVGALLFSPWRSSSRVLNLSAVCTCLLLGLIITQIASVANHTALLRLVWVKGVQETLPLYEKWNSFSRIQVNPVATTRPVGKGISENYTGDWGVSKNYSANSEARELVLQIDASAATVITAFDGQLDKFEYFKYGITNLAHHIRPASTVLVVGPGGGRDILSALAFGQKRVLGVEINGEIIDTVTKVFGDFTGHLDRRSDVTFVVDEARSYVARSPDRFDIIQLSLVDTWAATAAGAFVMTENSLYTVEAWKIFLEHLTPRGVLTASRWYARDRPSEMYRVVALAAESLAELGVENPRNHILVGRYMDTMDATGNPVLGLGTILVSREPLTEADVQTINSIAAVWGFEIVLTPTYALDDTFATVASGQDIRAFSAAFPLNISPPTDDSPFFFHMLRMRDIPTRQLWQQSTPDANFRAVVVLAALLAVVIVLSLICIVVPLLLTTGKTSLKGVGPLSLFFASIGLGFMLIEISQMQRLIVFLGHPTYSLSVVLFTLLLASGIGSFLTSGAAPQSLRRSATLRLGSLLFTLALFGLLTPAVTHQLQAATTPIRILVAIILLAPLGLLMGMAFPLGMKLASANSPGITPWLWGINGATSVCASVLAVVIAMYSGISTSFWVGFAAYVVALLAFLFAYRKDARTVVSSGTSRSVVKVRS